MLDGLPLRILEGIIGPSEVVAKYPGVERPTSVEMCFAKVGIAVGILLDALLGRGCLAGLLGLFWRLIFLARGEEADAENNQRQSRRRGNSTLHECLRLAECLELAQIHRTRVY